MLQKSQKKRYYNNRTMSVLIILSILFAITGFILPPDTSNKEPDRLLYFSGSGGGFRINDSTMYHHGNFSFLSASRNFKISAQRLKVSNQSCEDCNFFENDFLKGRVYKDIVDVYTNGYIFKDIMEFSADKINYSADSLFIELRGNAKVCADDIIIESNNINLNVYVWEKNTSFEGFLKTR